MENKPEKTVAEKKFENVVNLIIFLVSVSFSVAIIFFIFSTKDSPLKVNEIGQIGDFFGGTLNPLLTFITVALLIWSIRFQMDELKATREELKRSAESHKELVDQGDANFFINQAIKSFELSEKKIKHVLNMTIRVYPKNDFADGFPRYVAEVYHDVSGNNGGSRNCANYFRWSVNSLKWAEGVEKKLIPDKYSEAQVESLYSNVKHQIISLGVLIEYKGWSHALSCLNELKFNLFVLKHFKICAVNEALLIDIVENSIKSLDDLIFNSLELEEKYTTKYLISDLCLYAAELSEIAKVNPFEQY